ncbi:putative T7SS-secreted protein [Saccharopolyspora shandongensis]|uniref:putative T7SS-secreted protein n=1 Tax=Saccharopolyspora shandongensis TaxID=418495 RepID=UPI0033C821F0
MVSNSTTFDQDVAEAGHELHKLGQMAGVVAQDVIPGDPATVAEVGEHLTKLGGAFDRAGQGIKSIDSGGWTGQAGDAFRESYLDKAPAEWLAAADAFGDAGKAVLDYQKVLAEEKEKAARAKEELDRANEASLAAAKQHNAAVKAYESGSSDVAPSAFADPNAEVRARAEAQIAAAKAAVQAADERATRIVLEAVQVAPAKPSKLAQIGANLVDGFQGAGDLLYDFGAGAVEGVVGVGTGLWGLGEAFLYSQPGMWGIDPEGKAAFDKAASTTIMSVVENPYQAAKTIVDVDGWKQNPAKALGSMAPDAVASAFGGAGVATRATKIAGKIGDGLGDLGKSTDVARTADRLGDTARHAPEAPTTPWGDYDSLPMDRPVPDAPSNPYDGYTPDDGKPFGPQGSQPEPPPEPSYSPGTDTPGRPRPDWDDDMPDSWMDDGHRPDPHDAPDPHPHEPEAPQRPEPPSEPLPRTEADLLQELRSIEGVKEKLSQALDQGPPPARAAEIRSELSRLVERENLLRSRL